MTLRRQAQPPPGFGVFCIVKKTSFSPVRCAVVLLPLLLISVGVLRGQEERSEIDDITGTYQFISADDTLALLDEEGKLKGYIDVLQGEEESDAILSYAISIGRRKKNQVEFKTQKIHQKYYRFHGKVERGSGHEEADPDYLRLVGDLDIVTVKGETGQEETQTLRVVFKSKGRDEDREQ
jgi:hypothetical protein